MKKILHILMLFSMFILSSCSDDAPTGNSGGLGGGPGPGGGGTGNVTFTVAVAQDQQQQLYFEFKPSTGVIVNQVVAKCTAINVNETVTADGQTVFTNAEPLYVGPVQGLQQGQQWQFTITGKIGSAQGQNYTSNVNYTVQ